MICYRCGTRFEYQWDLDPPICAQCYDQDPDTGDFDADELGIDPEDEFDA